jgi:hypothetical protein
MFVALNFQAAVEIINYFLTCVAVALAMSCGATAMLQGP